MTPVEAESALSEYLDHLAAGDHNWCIPQQQRIRRIVAQLTDGVLVWPVMGGGYYPSDYPVVQRQKIQTALVNLRDNPVLLDSDSNGPVGRDRTTP